MEIAVEVLSAPAGMISSRRPSGDITVPPDASMVAVEGLPTGVPTAVGVPFEVSGGVVGSVEDLQETKRRDDKAKAKAKNCFINECASSGCSLAQANEIAGRTIPTA